MFGFANGLLLALFAAAAWDLVQAWSAQAPGTGRARRALRDLWCNDHYLFGNWGDAWRTRAGAVCFAAGLAAYEVSVAFCNSMARDAWPWVQGVLAPVLDWTAFLCFGAKILFGTRYTWRSLGVAGALYFIARWVYFNCHNIWWIGLVVAVMAAKDLPLEKSLKTFLITGVVAIALVAGLNFAGMLPPPPDLAAERNVYEIRGTYGYGHPNTFGGLVFGLVLAFAMLRAKKPRFPDAAVVAAVGVFLYLGPACRTASICCWGLAVLLVICRLMRDRALPRAVPALFGAAVPVLAAVAFLLPMPMVKNGPEWSDFGPAWMDRLDYVLTGRLSQVWLAYRLLDVKIAGQVLPDWPALDNSFVFSLYQFGPVVTVLLLVGLGLALWGFAKRGGRVEACCLLAMLVYAYMECQSFHLTTNPAALLLAGAVFAQAPRHWAGVYGPAKQTE